MDMELLKVLAPYFTSILGAVVAIGIAIFNNSSKTRAIQGKLSKVDQNLQGLQGKLSEVDQELQGLNGELSEVDKGLQGLKGEMEELKGNHFSSLGKYLRKLNAFLHRGKLMDDVEKADMDSLADGVAGKK